MNRDATQNQKTRPIYFVAATGCFDQVKDASQWVQTRARNLDGAKRLATKQASGTTYTARVATKNEQGDFEVLATLNDSSAITRSRATWKVHTH